MSDERLDRIEGLLQELVTKQALHAQEQMTMKEDLERVCHVLLEGNGNPPLTERVLANELKITRLEEERSDKKVPRAVWVGIVISGIFSVFGILTALV